jgi:nicotinamidase/pyrazinamidase
MKKTLLIIDPQNDFCDPSGALYVSGAESDIARISQLIREKKMEFDEIIVTLDTHDAMDIAHPAWWVDADGNNPNPFTIISVDDVTGGKWKPVSSDNQRWALEYVNELAVNDRYPLCIWPTHCVAETGGHAIHNDLTIALDEWESENEQSIVVVNKGESPYTEHYSAVKADVLIESDSRTDVNKGLINTLLQADEIVVVGEALSHCVANTVLDLTEYISGENFTLITDCASSVTGFEELSDKFINTFTALGGKTTCTEDIKNDSN